MHAGHPGIAAGSGFSLRTSNAALDPDGRTQAPEDFTDRINLAATGVFGGIVCGNAWGVDSDGRFARRTPDGARQARNG